jgi:hypothetical protein
MCQEPLFEYYDMPLHGLVIVNHVEEPEADDTAEEPELPITLILLA